MGRPVIMRAQNFDALPIKAGQQILEFFKDADPILAGPKAIELEEKKIVSWFFNSWIAGSSYLLYEELNISNKYRHYLEIGKPIIKDSGKPGDIDILLVNEDEPQFSIAFQVKKINGQVMEDGKIDFSKIHGKSNLQKGIEQVKESFKKYRFYKDYLMIVITTYAEKRKDKNTMFRHPSTEEVSRIYDFPGFGDLPEGTGVFILEITQPTLQGINFHCSMMSTEYIEAKPQEQLSDTTQRIVRLLKKQF